ncbi:NADP oxidoreductase [Trichlorobacter ammonificans]|uniref:[NiFe] hydrogenase, small subunit n=1 Tax=Trichlorobacter ammonificans TaxID=2916410 RepID=A0ABM9D9J2_9BACT|nr:NADP oxidoreductase [Trichlorobacter ammonificans]CAH2031902.1 [NiFe] hydrogenase, small subunit [Trichlorobacter ammonificans]
MKKLRLATAWLGGCSGCHMSFLDLGEELMELADAVELVYGPLVDAKQFPGQVDVALIEGALATTENLELLQQIRENSRIVVSLGDCAVTGNVTSLRNFFSVDDLLTAVYQAGPGSRPGGEELPELLPRVLPLHQVVTIDAFIPGCPPDPERIRTAVRALLQGEPVHLSAEQRTFG